jgi:flagellar hook-associated protein 1 FlgK
MPSAFHGINTAYNAIMSHTAALNTVSHNIANANTKGFSRQQAIMVATTPYTMPGMSKSTTAGQLGTGVEVSEIRQIRDQFLDKQFRNEMNAGGYWAPLAEALGKAEGIFNEPSSTGLNAALNGFWQAMQELGNDPGSQVTRALVAQKALALTDTLNHLSGQFQQMRQDYDDMLGGSSNLGSADTPFASSSNGQLGGLAGKINSYAKEIAELNKMIKRIEADPNMRANDWRDKRNLLIDELSELVAVQVVDKADGTVDILVKGQPLVMGVYADEIVAVKVPDPSDPSNPNAYLFTELRWADGRKFEPGPGKLQGIIDARDNIAAGFLAQLDELTKGMFTGINMLQKAGYGLNEHADRTGHVNDFFIIAPRQQNNPNIAGQITVNPNLMGSEQNLNRIAAASIPANSIAGISNYNNGVNAFGMATIIQSAIIGGQLTLIGEPAGRYLKLQDIYTHVDTFGPRVSAIRNNPQTGSIGEDGLRLTFDEPLYYSNAGVLTPLADGDDLGTIFPAGQFVYTRNGVDYDFYAEDGVVTYNNVGGIHSLTVDTVDAGSGLFPPQIGDRLIIDNGPAGNRLYDAKGNQYRAVEMEYTATGWEYKFPPGDDRLQVYDINGRPDPNYQDAYLAYDTNGNLRAYLINNNGTADASDDITYSYEFKVEFGASLMDYFRKLLTKLGVDANEANNMVTNQDAMINQLDQMRLSVMGVSLDEEMTNMIRFQHGYNAAARMMTTMDEMLDIIVNRLGLVGR